MEKNGPLHMPHGSRWTLFMRRRACLPVALIALVSAASVHADAVSVEPAKVFAGHDAEVYSAALSADSGLLATASYDKTVRLWNAGSAQAIATYKGHEAKVMCVAFSPDGQTIVSGSADKTLKLWQVVKQPQERDQTDGPEALRTFKEHPAFVHCVAFSPDGQTIASGSAAKTVHLWKNEDASQLHSLEAHESSVYAVVFSPDGKTLASSGLDTQIKLLNVADAKEIQKLSGHQEGVLALSFSDDGKFLYSGSTDRTVRKWNASDGQQVAVYEGHPGWVCGLGVLSGAERAVSVDYGGHVIVWDTAKGSRLSHRRLPTVVYSMTLSPDRKWIVTSNRGSTASLLAVAAE